MKSLKLAQNATNEVFANALVFGVVEISEGTYLCTGATLENLIKHCGKDSVDIINFDEVEPLDFYVYEPEMSAFCVDENNINDLNIVLEIIDCVEFEQTDTTEKMKDFANKVMEQEWLKVEAEDECACASCESDFKDEDAERHEFVESSLALSGMIH